MIPEFCSSRWLRNCAYWRPSTIQRLLGRPDAMLSEGDRPLDRAYLKQRVDAARTHPRFRLDERRIVRRLCNWQSLYLALDDAIETAGTGLGVTSRLRAPAPHAVLILDGIPQYVCRACGMLSSNDEHQLSDVCLRRRTPARITRNDRGFVVVRCDGLVMAHLYDDSDWAQQLALAIAGRQLAPVD